MGSESIVEKELIRRLTALERASEALQRRQVVEEKAWQREVRALHDEICRLRGEIQDREAVTSARLNLAILRSRTLSR